MSQPVCSIQPTNEAVNANLGRSAHSQYSAENHFPGESASTQMTARHAYDHHRHDFLARQFFDQ